MTQTDTSSKWADLAPRVLSAVGMAAIAIIAVALGGPVFLAVLAVVIGLCMWEFSRLIHAEARALHVVLGVIAGVSVIYCGITLDSPDPVALFSLPRIAVLLGAPLVGAALLPRHRVLFFFYAALIMLAGLGFVAMGTSQILVWFILVIIISDVSGYFAGRLLGGPKFWPRVSPKKTWSGTIAGWIGALGLGVIGAALGAFTPVEALALPLVAFAGQMGDIVQSAIKRKMGVKDSSNLIPGHGGVLDRFDAMIGASGAMILLITIASLSVAG